MAMTEARTASFPGRHEAVPALSARLPLPVSLYIFCVVLPITFQLGPLLMTSLRLLLLVLVVPMAFQLYSGRLGRLCAADFLFPLYVLWGVVTYTFTNPGMVVQQTGSVGVEFFGGYLLGRVYIRSPAQFIALARLLAIVVACFLPFALIESVTARPVLLELLNKVPGLQEVYLLPSERRLGLARVQLTFAHPIHFGLFCSVSFVLTFVALETVRSRAYRFLFTGVAGLCVFLSLSSGALLAVLLQGVLIAWQIVFRRKSWRWWLLVGLIALAYVVIDMLSNRTPIAVFMSYATFSADNAYYRANIFEYGMRSVWAHPIFGIGLNYWARPYVDVFRQRRQLLAARRDALRNRRLPDSGDRLRPRHLPGHHPPDPRRHACRKSPARLGLLLPQPHLLALHRPHLDQHLLLRLLHVRRRAVAAVRRAGPGRRGRRTRPAGRGARPAAAGLHPLPGVAGPHGCQLAAASGRDGERPGKIARPAREGWRGRRHRAGRAPRATGTSGAPGAANRARPCARRLTPPPALQGRGGTGARRRSADALIVDECALHAAAALP